MSSNPKRFLLYASQPYALPVLRPLQEEIRGRGGVAAWFFDGPGGSGLQEGETLLRTVAEVRDFDPDAVFVPGNRVPDFFPGVKVEVFHGFSVGKRSENRGHFRIRGFFDLYCTQGMTTTSRFLELAQELGHFRVVETGWPKMDPLFRDCPEADALRRSWRTSRPLVLFASTFTTSLSSAPHLLDRIGDLARSGPWNWLVTLHPKMPAEIVRAYRALEGDSLRMIESQDVVPALRAADLMVSDTSSVVHEFLLQRKPAVTFRNVRPGPHLIDIHDVDQLRSAVERGLERDPTLIRDIERFADAIHPYRDGRSSGRVLDATQHFIDQVRGTLRSKPLNLWRKLQIRRHLRYYRWR